MGDVAPKPLRQEGAAATVRYWGAGNLVRKPRFGSCEAASPIEGSRTGRSVERLADEFYCESRPIWFIKMA